MTCSSAAAAAASPPPLGSHPPLELPLMMAEDAPPLPDAPPDATTTTTTTTTMSESRQHHLGNSAPPYTHPPPPPPPPHGIILPCARGAIARKPRFRNLTYVRTSTTTTDETPQTRHPKRREEEENHTGPVHPLKSTFSSSASSSSSSPSEEDGGESETPSSSSTVPPSPAHKDLWMSKLYSLSYPVPNATGQFASNSHFPPPPAHGPYHPHQPYQRRDFHIPHSSAALTHARPHRSSSSYASARRYPRPSSAAKPPRPPRTDRVEGEEGQKGEPKGMSTPHLVVRGYRIHRRGRGKPRFRNLSKVFHDPAALPDAAAAASDSPTPYPVSSLSKSPTSAPPDLIQVLNGSHFYEKYYGHRTPTVAEVVSEAGTSTIAMDQALDDAFDELGIDMSDEIEWTVLDDDDSHVQALESLFDLPPSTETDSPPDPKADEE